MTTESIEDIIAAVGAPKAAAEDPRSDAEIDKLLGLEMSGRHGVSTWPRAALGVDAAGRPATPEEAAQQLRVYGEDKTAAETAEEKYQRAHVEIHGQRTGQAMGATIGAALGAHLGARAGLLGTGAAAGAVLGGMAGHRLSAYGQRTGPVPTSEIKQMHAGVPYKDHVEMDDDEYEAWKKDYLAGK